MSAHYRSSPSKAVVCDVCGQGPGPYGIMGWIFDINFVSCLDCRRPPNQNEEEVCAPKKTTLLDWFHHLFKKR